MATELKKILLRRGSEADTPTLDTGEPALVKDGGPDGEGGLIIGTDNGNKIVSMEGHRHNISELEATSIDGTYAIDAGKVITQFTLDHGLVSSYTAEALTPGDIDAYTQAEVDSLVGAVTPASIGAVAENASSLTATKTSYGNTFVGSITFEDGLATGHTTKILDSLSDYGIEEEVDAKIAAATFGDVDLEDYVEWTYDNSYTYSGDKTVTYTQLYGTSGYTFDFNNFDYKFICDIETNVEDNSQIQITLINSSGGLTGNRYTWMYDAFDMSSLSHNEDGDNADTSISTGLILPAANTGLTNTTAKFEFVVSRNLQDLDNATGQLLPYAFMVEGKGTMYGFTDTYTSPSDTIWFKSSKFTGAAILETDTYGDVDGVSINHGIMDGTVDNQSIKIYKRKR